MASSINSNTSPLSPKPFRVVGLLLAGGNSRRMGRPKASLPIAGKSLGALMVSRLEQAEVDRIVVSGQLPGFHCIADREANRGPLMGLYSAASELLAEGAGDALLVVPVDMPALSGTVLQRLVQTLRSRRLLDAARYDQRELPAVFRLHPGLLQVLEELLGCPQTSSMASFAQLHERLNAALLPRRRGDEECFVNLNSPKQWRTFVERHG